MAPTSALSSPDGLDNFVDSIALEETKKPDNGLDQFADQIAATEFADTKAAVRWSKQYDPNTYAEAAKLFPEAPEVGVRQLETLRDNDKLATYMDVFQRSPALRGYFATDPKKLAYANPDELDNVSGLAYLGQAGSEALKAGYDQYQAAMAANRVAAGQGTPADKSLLANYDGDRTFGARGWFDSGYVMAAQQVVPMGLTAGAALTNALKDSVYGGIMGAGVGSAVPGLGTVAGGATGMGIGARVGAVAGAYKFQQEFQTGLSRIYFSQLRDENGQPLEPELQNMAALLTGAGGALLESVSMSQMIRTIPGGDRIVGLITREGMAKALKNQTVRTALTDFAKNVGLTTATETTTEVLQQALQLTAEAAAKANSDGNFEQKTAAEVAEELYQTSVQTLQVMSVMGPLVAGTRFGADIYNIRNSKTQLDNIDKAVAHLEGNKLIERAPEVAAQVIDAQTNGQKIYIPASEALELYQSQGLDLYGPAIPNWRNRVDEALKVGGDIEVTLGEYVTYLGRDPKQNPLATLVRATPEGYTRAEIQPYEEALDSLIRSEFGDAVNVNPVAPQATGVVQPIQEFPELEQLKKEITRIGFAPKAVQAYTDLLGSFFNTMAARTGKSASEFFNEFQLSIQRGPLNETKEGTDSPLVELFQSAWHGSPHEFEKFDISKLGTGEGAQAFGWGMYFAESRGLAEMYQRTLSKQQGKGAGTPGEVHVGNVKYREGQDRLFHYYKYYFDNPPTQEKLATLKERKDSLYNKIPGDKSKATEASPEYERWLDSAYALQAAESVLKGEATFVPGKSPGRLFRVALPDDPDLVVMDDSLNKQSPKVQEVIRNLDLKKPGLLATGKTKAAYAILQEMKAGKDWDSKTGYDFYNTLSMYGKGRDKGGDKFASLTLLKAGIPGHKFLDGQSRKSGKGTYNFVIYDDQQVNVEEYFQENRGSIRVSDQDAVINLFAGHDMSTLLHEAGHFFLETLNRVKDVSPELQADWEQVTKSLGIKDGKITRDQHEQFARMAEAYFMEGKAPSPELRSAFGQFARWLKTLYRRISQLGGKVSPEIRGVFDRMLATEQRIDELVTDTAYAPLFKTAQEMGVDPQEYLAYQKLVDDLRVEAQESSRERIIGQANRLAKGWRGEIQKQLAKEAEVALVKMPPYSHMKLLKDRGVSIDTDSFIKHFPGETVKAKVEGESVTFGETLMNRFPQGTFKKNGTDIEIVSELLKYPSVDDMVYDFTQAKPLKEAAKEAAADEMARRYGDDFNNSEIMNLAIKQQMADDARLIVLGKELQVLRKRAGRSTSELGPKQLAVQIARDAIYAKKVGELNEVKTNAAVRRAAAMAEASVVKGDWAKAADWKRKQILAQAMANEVANVNRTLSKIRDKAARYSRTKPDGVDPAYMEQIRALVEQYDFAKISGKKLNKRMKLREFLDSVSEEGLVALNIPDRLLRDTQKVNWKELSVEDLIGLGETLDNLEHLGRLRNKLKIAGKLREFNGIKTQVLRQLESLPERKKKASDNYNEKDSRLQQFAMDIHGSLLKPEQIIEWLDAGDISGPMMEFVFQPIVEAQGEQNRLLLDYTDRVRKALDDVPSNYLSEIVPIKELGKKLTREEIYVMALNAGNESNRKKLIEGELITAEQLDQVLAHMTKEDWDRVQKVWDILDSLWERISAMEKRLTGVAPPKIEPREVVTEYGNYRGGYYPVVYDFKTRRGRNLIEDTTPADQVLASGLFNKQYLTPGTSHKHTVARTKVAKPIKLELSVLPGHIQKVVHDLAYREAVRGAYKILWDADIKQGIIDKEGQHTYDQLQHWLRTVATEHATENDWIDTALRRVRTGTTIFGMGFRATTMVAQGLGFFNSLVRVGARPLGHAIYQMTRHPWKTLELVNGMSTEMRDRFNNQDRDINDTVKSLSQSKLDQIRGLAFWGIGAMDKYVATATWLGAYNQYLQTSGIKDTQLAIMHADRTVRLSQGTGSVKDMAKVMNAGEKFKLFTMFYSAFSALYNAQVDLTRKTIRDIKAEDYGTVMRERIPQWFYLVVAPAIFGALISGNGPEEDEDYASWAARKTLMYPISGVPIVRDIVGQVDTGFGYQFSPATRAFDKSSQSIAALFSGKEQTMADRLFRTTEPAIVAGSIFFKLPTGQPLNTVEGLWKGLENDDLEMQDIFLGRRDK